MSIGLDYEDILKANGIEDVDGCMRWAFGDGFSSMLIVDSYIVYNERHPNGPLIYGNMTFIDSFKIIADEYRKIHEPNN